ncbi:hypothetical protein C8F01DRAFT_1153805 [Mycena amicta]|nr:hypothetical protein C8F01DRAFT_1153805 [Mycena amicta]
MLGTTVHHQPFAFGSPAHWQTAPNADHAYNQHFASTSTSNPRPTSTRRAQYKAHGSRPHQKATDAGQGTRTTPLPSADATTRLSALERSAKARQRIRATAAQSSKDGLGMDLDEDEDEDPLFDELFLRFMRHTTHTMQTRFMRSYEREVGADPEEEGDWEAELDDALQIPDDDVDVDAEELQALAAFADFADIPAEELFGGDHDLEDADDAMQIG